VGSKPDLLVEEQMTNHLNSATNIRHVTSDKGKVAAEEVSILLRS
jgi:hypothetical protein